MQKRENIDSTLTELLVKLSRYSDQMRFEPDGHVTFGYEPKARHVSAGILKRLAQDGVENLPNLEPLKSFQHRFYQLCKKDPRFFRAIAKAGFDLSMPESSVHVISRGTNLLVDINGADFLAEALIETSPKALAGKKILDFGGSSGRTSRTMAFGLPNVNWFNCDPAPSSIAWGEENIKEVSFFLSYQEPPLPVEDASFDGFYAKSIWTHFSEASSKRWLREMARVVKPGGFALITAHGPQDLARRITWGAPSPRYDRLEGFEGFNETKALSVITGELVEKGFFFRPYAQLEWQGDIREAEDATTADWGLTFVTKDWFSKHLEGTPWRLNKHLIGRTGFRHDLFLLERI